MTSGRAHDRGPNPSSAVIGGCTTAGCSSTAPLGTWSTSPMPTATVNGLSIAYEVIGDGERSWVITPGGRFSKDDPGVRELAEAPGRSRADGS